MLRLVEVFSWMEYVFALYRLGVVPQGVIVRGARKVGFTYYFRLRCCVLNPVLGPVVDPVLGPVLNPTLEPVLDPILDLLETGDDCLIYKRYGGK